MKDVLNIIQIGHPTLRKIADPVDPRMIGSAEIQQFIDQLIATKRAANGAGIAANQVDSTHRIFVAEAGYNPRHPYRPEYPLTVLINPELTLLTDDRFDSFEGCLSVPGLRGVVSRCPIISIKGYNRDGDPVDFEVRGMSAAIFQHEHDHLDGVLYTDKLTDPKTLCSSEEFDLRCGEDFKRTVLEVEQRYNA